MQATFRPQSSQRSMTLRRSEEADTHSLGDSWRCYRQRDTGLHRAEIIAWLAAEQSCKERKGSVGRGRCRLHGSLVVQGCSATSSRGSESTPCASSMWETCYRRLGAQWQPHDSVHLMISRNDCWRPFASLLSMNDRMASMQLLAAEAGRQAVRGGCRQRGGRQGGRGQVP